MKNIKNRFYLDLLGLQIEKFDPNPIKEYRKNTNDCFIRACCRLLNKDWDTVFKEVAEIAFKNKSMYNSIIHVGAPYLSTYNYEGTVEYLTGKSVGELMYQNKHGSYLIGNKDHIVCYIDGVIYDKNFDTIDLFLTSKAAYIFSKSDQNKKEEGKENE